MTATLAPAPAHVPSSRTRPRAPWSAAGRGARRAVTAAAYLAAVGFAWSWYVRSADVPPYLLPPPGDVWTAGRGLVENGQLWPNVAHTVRNITIGFVGGSMIGMALGYAIWRWRLAREVLAPYVVLLQAAPKIAFAPLLVLWFGIGATTELVLVLLLAFFPMMVAMQFGLGAVSPDLAALGRVLGLSPWAYFRTIQFRVATPALMAGAKVAVVDAMTGAFLAEYITAQQGLGYLMVLGNTSYNTPLLVAAVVVTVVIGLAGFGLVSLVEAWLLRWRD
jgi:NitT/TauT family transport system permease protein